MPFGLRNASATYQRCMQKCLFDQIGKNVQVYVDDIVIKTKVKDTLIDDIRQTFDNLRRFRMKLNPAKCTFGVPAGRGGPRILIMSIQNYKKIIILRNKVYKII
jgi:hypothetical protein